MALKLLFMLSFNGLKPVATKLVEPMALIWYFENFRINHYFQTL